MGLFPNGPNTAVDAAIHMQRSVDEYNRELARAGRPVIAIGVGLHRGLLMLGAIGERKRIETTVIADAVNVAARTESLTKPFHASVIATKAVVNALARPHEYQLRPLGEVVVYGASRGIEMFEIFDGDAPEKLFNKVRTLDDFTAGVRAFTAGKSLGAADAFARVLAESAPAAPWDGRIRMEVK
jgi:two-component system sensor histidine kinase ChiS